MAEGGDLSRSEAGESDALLNNECYHNLYYKNHTVTHITSSSKSTNPLPARKGQGVEKCLYHPDCDIEKYCEIHDMVYWSLCIAEEHRSCSGVKEIDQVAQNTNKSDLHSLLVDFSSVIRQLERAREEKSNHLKLIKERKDCLLHEIKALRKKMNDHFDELEQIIIAELDDKQNNLEEEINTALAKIDHLVQTTDIRKPDIKFNYDSRQTFIHEKIGRMVLVEAENDLQQLCSLNNSVLHFTPSNVLCDLLEKVDHFGKINHYNVKSHNDINIKLKSEDTCWIDDMCQLSDGTVLLTDFLNYKLKRLDGKYDVKDSMQFDTKPWSICCISPTEVAVRLKDDTVQFISVGKKLSYEHKITLTGFRGACKGMTYCNNQLWISGDKAVYIYTLSGALVQRLETDSNGQEVFTKYNPRHLSVSNDGTRIYVTVCERIVVFNNEGKLMNTFCDDRLDVAVSVCCLDDLILVGGCKSRNIVMFDKYGNSICELLSGKAMISPCSLCYDNRTQCIIVGCSDDIRVFQLQ
ncbi:hypothetical protein ACF0H5_021402 [Mactra antiquata]